MNIEELDLSANDMHDDCRMLIKQLFIVHQEANDEQVWLYGLRNEKPPRQQMSQLKYLNLSHNMLTSKTVHAIAVAVRNNKTFRQLNLRANQLDNEGIKELKEVMFENNTLLNLDVRQNPGLTDTLHQTLYLLMLKNQRRAQLHSPIDNTKYFYPVKIKELNIPKSVMTTFLDKVEQIMNKKYSADSNNQRVKSTSPARYRSPYRQKIYAERLSQPKKSVERTQSGRKISKLKIGPANNKAAVKLAQRQKQNEQYNDQIDIFEP